MNDLCPCGSKQDYTVCCGAIISDQREAGTALELMKSRYTAYTNADIDYLMRSHHSSTRPIKERKSIKRWAESVKWMQLIILNTWDGTSSDEKGYIEFKALFLENGQINQIHEKSFFKREKEKWVYVSGAHF
ncbi:YchJ family metal-binding protein [Prolixibacteraceae bacterium Z1-6]|uniref:YchJ family metal-binding protein n=1 Tax=Draconibacterium aestuarii TaxID=2998507 RepID=A0A9X3FD23_9BACT|nr:YchJ family metal-binding protein [Prolixibacteraceae bacterium Z1-6]